MTRSRLIADLNGMGVAEHSAVMVHTSMSAIGWVVRGASTLINAPVSVLGPTGTVMVLTGWEDRPPFHQGEWNNAERTAYLEECPHFDPRVSRAEVAHGPLPEAVRTWPRARHSAHPVDAFASIGADAAWLVSGQSLDEGYGTNSPLARLVKRDGSVLLLGAPLDSVTLLHYAEYLATAGPKRWNEYKVLSTCACPQGYRQQSSRQTF